MSADLPLTGDELATIDAWLSTFGPNPRATVPMPLGDVLRLVAEVERLRALSERLAAGLGLALHDAHPMYGSTTGWRGGIGGAAMTQGCSITDPPPGEDWMGLTLEDPLRDFMRALPDFDLNAAKERLAVDLRAALDGP